MQCTIFTDHRYHAEKVIDIDPSQVVSVEETKLKLFLAGWFDVTKVKLADGHEYTLRGKLAEAIVQAKKESADQ